MQRILLVLICLVQLGDGRRTQPKVEQASQASAFEDLPSDDEVETSALELDADVDESVLDSAKKELASFLLAFNGPHVERYPVTSAIRSSGRRPLVGTAPFRAPRMQLTSTQSSVTDTKGVVAPLNRVPAEPRRQVWPNADLTPAVDKFATVPTEEELEEDMPMTATGPQPDGPDPFKLVEKDLESLSEYVSGLMTSENPILTQAATVFFDSKMDNSRQGKRFRPTIVALVSQTLADGHVEEDVKQHQLNLGKITEMIHVASLIHDDVLDEADTRRGGDAVHAMYNNKVAVLAGDYLLARASMLLARLQHSQVVEVMASALDALVQGEMMQALSKKEALLEFRNYLKKSYYKTASLISCSCKSAALLAGYEENSEEVVAAEQYGYHLGMAYQIVDDILDFTGASATLGKPAQADMQLGLATAPILYASEVDTSLKPLILRKFKNDGDVVKAVGRAKETDCVAKSYKLAEFHAKRALEALHRLPENESRQALEIILHKALSRSS